MQQGIIGQGESSYSLSRPNSVDSGEIPTMDMQRVLPRQVSTGVGRGVQQLGSPNVYVDAGNEQIIVQKIVPQVLMGKQATFGEGFFVTRDGVDVTKNTDPSNFIFNSNQNVFKIVSKGLTTITPSASTTTISSFPHGLDFVPIVQGYLNNATIGSITSNGSLALPTWLGISVKTFDVTGGGSYPVVAFDAYMSIFSDQTNVYILCTNAIASPLKTFTITYYLLQESAQA